MAQLTIAMLPYGLWHPRPLKKCPFSWGDLNPHVIHGSLGPTRVFVPNGISIGSAIYAGLAKVINRQTDHATPCVVTSHYR